MEIAQTALAVLDVGLDAVAQLTGAPVALVALGHLGLDEVLGGALYHLALEAPHQVFKQRLVAEDQAGIEKGGADGDVGACQLERLIDGARSVTHLQAEVPEQIEHIFDDALTPGRLLVGQQEQQIDVREGCQQTAAVAAGRHDGHVLGVGWIGGAVDVGDGVVVDEADQLVLECG